MTSNVAFPDWDTLRRELQDAGNAEPTAYLALLEEHGQHDPEFAAMWCAYGVGLAQQIGWVEEAVRWLRRSLDLGWFQEGMIQGYGTLLDAQPDAAALRAQLGRNLPSPPLELLDWPDAPPGFALPPVRLSSGREARLRAELPVPQKTALGTALALLSWTHTRWQHAGSSPAEDADALTLLERSRAGERFRCVEYSVLLTSALQACGIPAMPLGLTFEVAHAGLGMAHAVTAAWLDDLGAWVLLDGQNGGVWHDGDLRPLGVAELVRRCRVGEAPPQFSEPDGTPVPEAEGWWPYLYHAHPGGRNVAGPSFVPVFQGRPYRSDHLTRHVEALWPNLDGLMTAVVSREGRPALTFTPLHPYACGVEVEGEPVSGEGLVLPTEPGEYTWNVQVLGPYGPLRGQALRFRVR